MMILKHIATGVSFLGAVCVLAAADFRIPAETLRGGAIAPPGVDQVDGELGNLPLEKFRAIRERFTLNFDSDSFPEHPETVDIGVNRMVFSGFRRASKAGYFISAPNALVGAGRMRSSVPGGRRRSRLRSLSTGRSKRPASCSSS